MSSLSIAESCTALVSARIPYREAKKLVAREIVRVALNRNGGIYNRTWMAIDCAPNSLKLIERRAPEPSQPQLTPVISALGEMLLDEEELYRTAMARFMREIAAAGIREAGSGRAAAPLLHVHRNWVPRLLRAKSSQRGFVAGKEIPA
jgi:hypothetical protein